MNSYGSVKNFYTWLFENGIQWESQLLSIHHCFRNGCSFWSVRAGSNLNEDDSLVWIPSSAVLCPKNSNVGSVLNEEGISGGLALVVTVAYERSLGSHSKWACYLACLPDFAYLPIFWSEKELLLLKSSPLFDAVQQDIEFLKEDYESVVVPLLRKYPDVFRKGSLSFDDFLKSASLVSSRDFYVDPVYGRALVPFADAFNHKCCIITATDHVLQEENSDETSDENAYPDPDQVDPERRLEIMIVNEVNENGCPGLQLRAAKDIAKGNEIFNTYGELSNEELLMKYGFCVRDNVFDYVSVDANVILQELEKNLAPINPAYAVKAQTIKNALSNEEISTFRLYRDVKSCAALNSVLTFLFCQKDESAQAGMLLDATFSKSTMPDIGMEGQNALLSAMLKLLKQYSIEHPLTHVLFQSSREIINQWTDSLRASKKQY